MPFSIFAVKSIQFAEKPLKHRINTIKYVYYAKCTSAFSMFSGFKAPLITKLFTSTIPAVLL